MTDTSEAPGDPITEEVDGGSEGESGPGESEMAQEKTFDYVPAAGIVTLFTITVAAGIWLAVPFEAAGIQVFQDPSAITNIGVIVVEVLVATALLLLAFRWGKGDLVIKVLILGSLAYLISFPVRVLSTGLVPSPTYVGAGVGIAFALALWVFPEWYVIDLAGVTFGAAGIALFGTGLTPALVILLLVVMAAYDAYSVYVSEHMQSLGSGVIDLKLPMVFIIPADWDFSMREVDTLKDLEGSAMLLGVGDAVFPGILGASAAIFLAEEAPAVVAGLNAPALGTLVGAFVGMIGLEILLEKVRRTHAGLPVLNTFTLAGYVAGSLVAGVPLATAFGL